MKNKKLVIILVFFSLLPSPLYLLFAESEFSFRLAPSIEESIDIQEFATGLGANVSLDWAWRTNAQNYFNRFSFGLSAGGTYLSLPFETGDPLDLIAGTGGLFVRYRPFDRFAFRASANAGYYQYSREKENAVNILVSSSFGTEFFISPYFSLYADGSYTNRAFSSKPLPTYGAAAGIRLNLSEIMSGRTRVRINKTEDFPIFPVSWAWYRNHPVATVRVTNDEPNAIKNVNLSLFMDSYMSQPFTFAVIPHIPAGGFIDVPVTALFNEAMMNLTENVIATGIIQTQYRSLGSRKETTADIQMPIYHRNTISWDDDRRAAAFVSPNDFAALFFARSVDNAITGELTGRIPNNVVKATALFEALRLYGISYVVVPATSFARLAADKTALDNVSFPYQALFFRGGDCSYLSILFCSMLEAMNIESAFITVPGHIYIAFEVGSDTWMANSNDIITIDGKRWMPVELTVPREGFNRAWRVGARQWRTHGANAVLYPIREAWEIYPSVTVPASGDNLPDMPQPGDIVRAIQRELALLR